MNLKNNKALQNVWLVGATLGCLLCAILSKSTPIALCCCVCLMIFFISVGYYDRTSFWFGMFGFAFYAVLMWLLQGYASSVAGAICAIVLAVGGALRSKFSLAFPHCLKTVTLLLFAGFGVIFSVAIALVLSHFAIPNAWLEAFAATSLVCGAVLSAFDYVDQWLFYLWSSGVNLAIWIIKTCQSISNLAFVLLWGFCLINTLYVLIANFKYFKHKRNVFLIKNIFKTKTNDGGE